jgi:hypothetical protein
MDIEQFYSSDERRRQSAEIEFGTEWRDAQGNRYELSWVEDTGEIYTMLELVPGGASWTPFGDIEVENIPVDRLVVLVIGFVPERSELERILDGWQDKMSSSDSISWVADRLKEAGVPKSAPV